jgi:hydroxymethylpyrimidine/phosphomethylpyrimidine kinase
VRALGAGVVVLTGGHRDEVVDLYYDGERLVEIPGPRYADGAAHGSGCTHSSLVAALLARGREPLAAARMARELAGAAVRRGLRDVGRGAGPVDVLDLAERRRASGETAAM